MCPLSTLRLGIWFRCSLLSTIGSYQARGEGRLLLNAKNQSDNINQKILRSICWTQSQAEKNRLKLWATTLNIWRWGWDWESEHRCAWMEVQDVVRQQSSRRRWVTWRHFHINTRLSIWIVCKLLIFVDYMHLYSNSSSTNRIKGQNWPSKDNFGSPAQTIHPR